MGPVLFHSWAGGVHEFGLGFRGLGVYGLGFYGHLGSSHFGSSTAIVATRPEWAELLQIGVLVSRLIAMDSASRRLCACIGYAIRQAAREKRQDVAQPLWQALHIMTTPDISREPISLWSALGLSEGEFPESALSAVGGSCGPKAGQTSYGFLDRTIQTEVEVITRGEFEKIMQRNMETLSTYQKTLEALSLRLASCEQLGGDRAAKWI